MSKETTQIVAFSEKMMNYVKGKLVTTFSEEMMNYAKDKLTENQLRVISKNSFLLNKKADFIHAKAQGYTYSMIAEVATIEFLKSGEPRTFSVTNKEGKKVEFETKIRVVDIKNICEPEKDK